MATFLLILFFMIAVLLILVVLLQKGRGGGLGAAFGGGSSSAFGTRTGDVFTWVTIVLTGLFLLLAILSSLAVRPEVSTVAMPVFEPAAAPAEPWDELNITINSPTRGAIIRFTINEGEPDESSQVYGRSAIRVEPGDVLRARAFRAGLKASDIREVTYRQAPVPAPTVSPLPGVITGPTPVSVSRDLQRAVIHYTLDGTEPTTDSPELQTDSLTVQPGMTLMLRGFDPEGVYRPSKIVVAEYTEPQAEPATTEEATGEESPDQPPASENEGS